MRCTPEPSGPLRRAPLRRHGSLWFPALLAIASLAPGCGGDDQRLLLLIDGDGISAGEVAEVRIEVRDDGGDAIGDATFVPPPGARFPLVGERGGSVSEVASVVIELRGLREILARAEFAVDAGAGDQVELRLTLVRGVYTEGCADLDGDSYGAGPDCSGPDCDDGDPNVNPGREEICGDGTDNNCSGLLEEGCSCIPGAAIRCFTGPRRALEFGRCRVGNQSCVGGAYGPCEGEIAPLNEGAGIAGIDDDCDGIFDEVEPCIEGALAPCFEGPPGLTPGGLCASGFRECRDGIFGECRGQRLPTAETCGNFLDDDCDGDTDEAADCFGGRLRYERRPSNDGGISSSGAPFMPDPCTDETQDREAAVGMSGDAISFSLGGLDLPGRWYRIVVVELGVHPPLGAAELTYETTGGRAESSEGVTLDLPEVTSCGLPTSFEVPAPWSGVERVSAVQVNLRCAEGETCSGRPLALRALELLP